MSSTRDTSQGRGHSNSPGVPPSDPHTRTGERQPSRWTGLGVSMGAGVGMTVGLLVAGGNGMALGIAIGAAIGVIVGSAIDLRH